MNKYFAWILFVLLVATGVMLRFSTSHEKMPVGCDEFGYLNLAKSMDKGNVFSYSENKPFLNGLIDTLRKEDIAENEIAWMIAPHAYHLLPDTYTVINQYPPATSFILQFIPIIYRNLFFPLIVFLIMIIATITAGHFAKKFESNWFELLFLIFIFIITVAAPFTTEFSRVNSLAPTFGLLIASGILLKKFPFWSCFLIALTINFRVANAILLIPAVLFLKPTLRELFSFKVIIKFLILVFLAVLPLLYYNYMVTGSAFVTTYSSIDTAGVNKLSGIVESVKFYLNFNQYWFRVHLLVISILLLLGKFQNISASDLLKYLVIVTINYLFFFYHSVQMNYYPYASALIIIGVLFYFVSQIEFKLFGATLLNGVIITIGLIVFSSGLIRYNKKQHLTFNEAKNQYNTLCKFDVVWADLYSGTTEYVCNNSGFRYGVTTPRARKLALQYLKNNGYSQAILLTDNTVEPKIVEQEILSLGYNFVIKDDSIIGNYIQIK